MAGSVKLLTSAGGGVILDTATTTATDVTVKVPVTGVNNGTLVCSDSSGNVGIGTSSPATKLQVDGSSEVAIAISTSGTREGAFYSDGSLTVLNAYQGNPLVFSVASSGTSYSERMRIDSSGTLLVGTASLPAGRAGVVVRSNTSTTTVGAFYNDTATNPFGLHVNYSAASPNGTGNEFLYCVDSTTARATIRSNGGLANYSANNVNLSDRREKTDFEPAKSYLETICSIPVQTYKYIDQADEDKTLGVVAQDVQAVAPELVDESNWGTEEEPKMRLSIYQTDLQYALMKCIQELSAKNDALEARIAALEAK